VTGWRTLSAASQSATGRIACFSRSSQTARQSFPGITHSPLRARPYTAGASTPGGTVP